VADYHPPSEGPSKEYPFALITGRSVYHFHTRTKTARVGALQRAAPDAWVELHPDDAANLGIHEGDLVRVENEHGKVEVAARIARIAKGQVFVPMHYGAWDRHDRVSDGCIRSGRGLTGGSMRSTAANELTTKLWDPVSKQPLLKSAAVKLTRLASAAEAAEQIQVELHRKTSPTQKKKTGLVSCLTHCVPDSASSSASSSSASPPLDTHPHGAAVSKQSKKFSESGGVEASVPDTN
jgi:predicted molibdopterin-dependent oxidoreductase YjgC